MRNFILMALILFAFHGGFSQDPLITVIPHTATINDRQDTVFVIYDIPANKKIQFYNIFLKITLDGEEIRAKGLSGDVGNMVTPGRSKKIIWSTTIDVLELSGELKIEVLTDTKEGSGSLSANRQDIKIIPAYAGLGGTVVTAGTLAYLGYKANSDYKESFKPLYDIYTANKNPNDVLFYGNGKISREEHYDEANKKYKKGQYYLAAGGAVLAAGGYLMISRIIKINKYKKDMATMRSSTSNESHKKPYFLLALNNPLGIPSMGLQLNF